MSKGGGGGGPSEVTQVSTNLPEYARPYFEEVLERAAYESTRPYEAFPGQRIADFTPYEQMGMRGMYDMAAAGTPQQLAMASDIAAQEAYAPTNMGMQIASSFQPQNVVSGYRAGSIDSGYTAGDLAQGYDAGQRSVTYRPTRFDAGYDAGTLAQSYQPGQMQVDYSAGQFDPGYDARNLRQDYTARKLRSQYTGDLDVGPGFQAGTIADPQTLQQYMNPYQQLVTDIEKREAQRQSDIAGSQISQQAAATGGLGGYREAILQSEREKNLGQQLADIQATGGQRAYDQAIKAFEADRAARLQEAQFGLTAAQAKDKARRDAEQLKQSAFSATEQARQTEEQLDQNAFRAGESARQEAARLGLTAQQQEDAAKQAEQKFKADAFALNEANKKAAQELDAQAFQVGEAAKQRAAELGLNAQQQEDASRRAAEEFRQAQFAQNEQLRLAEQQENRAAYQAGEAARAEAARLGLSAHEIEERARQAENDARIRVQEFNTQMAERAARLGLEGLGIDEAGRSRRLDAARLLGGFGSEDQRLAVERLRNLQTAGQIQRDLQQRGFDMGYQDFLRQQAFPREQLAYFSNILRGLPIAPGSTTASFGPQVSPYGQALGAGIGGVGLYNAFRGVS